MDVFKIKNMVVGFSYDSIGGVGENFVVGRIYFFFFIDIVFV